MAKTNTPTPRMEPPETVLEAYAGLAISEGRASVKALKCASPTCDRVGLIEMLRSGNPRIVVICPACLRVWNVYF